MTGLAAISEKGNKVKCTPLPLLPPKSPEPNRYKAINCYVSTAYAKVTEGNGVGLG